MERRLRRVVYLMAPSPHAATQSKHTTQREESTTWSAMEMHRALQACSHARQLTQRSVSMSKWKSDHRAGMLRALPTGHTVLHITRPLNQAAAPTAATVCSEMSSATPEAMTASFPPAASTSGRIADEQKRPKAE